MNVDVAINVYGKPFQTAVALLSLLRHSGEHVGKVYFIQEPKQPGDIDFRFIHGLLSDKIIVHTPKYWHSCDRTLPEKLEDDEYRRSLRYQYAWEESSADYLFVTHNDVFYKSDIIGEFLGGIDDNAAIGQIGQCWNCPASLAGLCDGERYWDFRPTIGELEELYEKHPTGRWNIAEARDDMNPWPLPECRVNEWTALINLKIARPETIPFGDALPFGSMTLDIGTGWFRQMSYKGYKFANHPLAPFAFHGWTTGGGGGHQALFEYAKYEHGEQAARAVLINEFGIDPATLADASGGRWRTRLRTFMRGKLGR